MDFQKALGRKVWQVGSVNVIKYNLLLGKSYLYAPRCGENFLSDDFLKKIREIAKKENAIFFKIELLRQAQGRPFRKSTNIQPRKTLVLDITKSEKKLLVKMHHKTRYNIRLAERKNIKIRKDKEGFEEFWKLLQQTTKRDGFRPHPKEYYKKMLEISGVELFTATFKKKVIAANIVVFYKKTAIYLHGASDYKYRNLMAPYLLQWHQILEAKKRDCTEYDFWGIDEKKWPGVTRFKKGFNGKEVIYLGAYDLIFQPIWYRIYKVAKKIL
jgi:lipid II:glycine glycyltransferase (peptidoglycan interpeptide bridge formation enzyme)